jgi:tetratricopeptide (TPR) repeat protein
MVDLYLQAMMQGEFFMNKASTSDSKIDAEIDKLLDQEEETDPNQDSFNTPAMKKAKLKAEIKEALQFKELAKYIESALNIIIQKGKTQLKSDEYEGLMETFSHAREFLDLPSETLESFQQILHITNDQMDAIAKVGIEDFNQSQYDDCMAVFILLATLRPDIADYWYRAGIAAHKVGLFEQAIKFYNAAWELDPSLVGALLFIIDCELNLNMLSDAESHYDKAKSLSETKEMDEDSRGLLAKLDAQIKANIDIAGG